MAAATAASAAAAAEVIALKEQLAAAVPVPFAKSLHSPARALAARVDARPTEIPATTSAQTDGLESRPTLKPKPKAKANPRPKSTPESGATPLSPTRPELVTIEQETTARKLAERQCTVLRSLVDTLKTQLADAEASMSSATELQVPGTPLVDQPSEILLLSLLLKSELTPDSHTPLAHCCSLLKTRSKVSRRMLKRSEQRTCRPSSLLCDLRISNR